MSSSYSTALSGLLANSTALNVVGDNLANMNTEGFKSNTLLFQDAIAQASATLQVGLGVEASRTQRNFTQGTIQTTKQPFDVAIQGSGFYVVQSPTGDTMYTRDGSFDLNAAGQLVTAAGDLVQGWNATGGVLNASGATATITVPALNSEPPKATANITMSANLNASTATNGTFSTPIQVIDSLGQAHTLTATFTDNGGNAWSYALTIPGADVKGGTAGSATTVATGNLTFDSSGNLTSPAPTDPPVVVQTTGGMADGAADFNINWNFYSNGTPTVTQYAQTSAASGTTQDGVQAATVTGVTLQNGGMLVANYSNGNSVTIAQVALASIANPDSLIAVTNNNYALGNTTLTPSVGVAGTAQRGNIVAGSVETSNVDMATEFTNLIVFQRGYQANSKVITTLTQMDQTLLAINP